MSEKYLYLFAAIALPLVPVALVWLGGAAVAALHAKTLPRPAGLVGLAMVLLLLGGIVERAVQAGMSAILISGAVTSWEPWLPYVFLGATGLRMVTEVAGISLLLAAALTGREREGLEEAP